MSIYKPCDIRGDATKELSPELYVKWGRALGARLDPGAAFVIGGDVRESTPRFLEALRDGLAAAGMNVLDAGILPTPMLYFAKRHSHRPGVAIVTASHSPACQNGLKWMIGNRPPSQADVQALRIAARDDEIPDRAPGVSTKECVETTYLQWLTSFEWPSASDRPMKLIVDPGGGCWAGRAAIYLESIFPFAEVEAIHDGPDGRFRGRNPDCSRPEHLGDLSGRVVPTGAALGVAFDGDGDRVAFVDEDGTVLSAEETTWLLLRIADRLLRTGSAEDVAFVHDVKFSDRIAEAARAAGLEPTPERSGHAFIRARMYETRAPFGAEISGHYFYGFRDPHGYDIIEDALFTACLMIRHLIETGASLAELRRRCPPVFMTADLRPDLPAEEMAAALERIREAFSDRPQSSVDGVRIDFENGWALARRSVTEPKLTFRFEGDSSESLKSIVNTFCAALPGIGPGLLKQFRSERDG